LCKYRTTAHKNKAPIPTLPNTNQPDPNTGAAICMNKNEPPQMAAKNKRRNQSAMAMKNALRFHEVRGCFMKTCHQV
jgi:hypothetical protein